LLKNSSFGFKSTENANVNYTQDGTVQKLLISKFHKNLCCCQETVWCRSCFFLFKVCQRQPLQV